jgi:hypothetical protein
MLCRLGGGFEALKEKGETQRGRNRPRGNNSSTIPQITWLGTYQNWPRSINPQIKALSLSPRKGQGKERGKEKMDMWIPQIK